MYDTNRCVRMRTYTSAAGWVILETALQQAQVPWTIQKNRIGASSRLVSAGLLERQPPTWFGSRGGFRISGEGQAAETEE